MRLTRAKPGDSFSPVGVAFGTVGVERALYKKQSDLAYIL